MKGRECRLLGCPGRPRDDLDGYCSRAHLQAAIAEPVRQAPIEQDVAELDPPTDPVLSPVAADAAVRAPGARRWRWRWVLLGLAVFVLALGLYGRQRDATAVGSVVAPTPSTSTVATTSAAPLTEAPSTSRKPSRKAAPSTSRKASTTRSRPPRDPDLDAASRAVEGLVRRGATG